MSVFKPEWIDKHLGCAPALYVHAGAFDAANALAFKQAHPGCRILCFEACPDMYRWCADQKRNEVVEITHGALCAHDGEVPFMSSYSSHGEAGNGSVLLATPELSRYNERLRFHAPRLVPAYTLEKYCVHHNIKDIDALHLDLQGAEMLALVGFGQIRPKLLYVEHGETEHYIGASSQASLNIGLERMGYRRLDGDGWAALYKYDPVLKEPLLLSVLIPSIPSRLHLAQALVSKLEAQIGNLPVQICLYLDNKKVSIGEKRDALVGLGRGIFCTQQDDDDTCSPDYISELVAAIRANPDVDVIAFQQRCVLDNHQPFVVHFGLEYENEQVVFDQENKTKANDIHRKPWTCCAWRRTLAQQHHFEASGLQEDYRWLQQLWAHAKTQVKIDNVLHTYRFNSKTSEGDQTKKAGV